eukprot:Sspe_Gene.80774::Locus_51174_Transcript_1_1_Confidence_1.000_Length_556::g.80774::m.80774
MTMHRVCVKRDRGGGGGSIHFLFIGVLARLRAEPLPPRQGAGQRWRERDKEKGKGEGMAQSPPQRWRAASCNGESRSGQPKVVVGPEQPVDREGGGGGLTSCTPPTLSLAHIHFGREPADLSTQLCIQEGRNGGGEEEEEEEE